MDAAALLRAFDGGRTLAIAESVTGGLVAARITAAPGASRVLRGAIVAYTDEAKADLLGLSRDLLARGAVSADVARTMAAAVRARFRADVGIATTGFADGPEAGTVHLGAAVDGHAWSIQEQYPGDRGRVIDAAARAALALSVRALGPGWGRAERSGDVHEGGRETPSP